MAHITGTCSCGAEIHAHAYECCELDPIVEVVVDHPAPPCEPFERLERGEYLRTHCPELAGPVKAWEDVLNGPAR